MTTLLPLGTRVDCSAHGAGTVVAYSNRHALELGPQPRERVVVAVACGLIQPLVDGLFYNADKYPYVVQFDSGFREVYGPRELRVLD